MNGWIDGWVDCPFNREDLGTKLSCFGCENKNGGHFTRSKSKN